MDVGEDQARALLADGVDRLGMRTRDVDNAMTEFLDQRLQNERDERLVLDDQHVGADLVGNFLAGSIDQPGCLGGSALEDARNLRRIEALE